MKLWNNFNLAIILIMGIIVIAFDAQLYVNNRLQKGQLDAIKDKLDVEAEFNSNKFKYQQEQIDRLAKDLDNSRQQLKEQKDALVDQKESLLAEIGKRQQTENENKSLQMSLVDIKAEADAIKQDIKAWQKDYAAVAEGLDQKVKFLEADIAKISHPPDNSSSGALALPDTKVESSP